jgi:hypothetical protein
MPDDTTAALQALIKQVETLTTTVTDQQKRMDSLHDFNGRILDEKKDMQRQLEQQTETDKKLADMGYERAPDGNYHPKGTKPAHTLTREEARDPQKYRAAKDAAAKTGATLQIVDPQKPEDAHRRASRSEIDASLKTTLIRDDDQKVAYMRRDAMGSDARQYRQLRADGFNVQQWSNADDLPQHMQTKLALMEKSNDA